MANTAAATQDFGRQELCLPGVFCLERARVPFVRQRRSR